MVGVALRRVRLLGFEMGLCLRGSLLGRLELALKIFWHFMETFHYNLISYLYSPVQSATIEALIQVSDVTKADNY